MKKKSAMKNRGSKPRIEVRPIDSLKPHPAQANIFDDLDDVQLDALAGDIQKNGLLNPVEITTDGTIIAGHQRVKATQRLGKTEIQCWIREDLEQQGDAAIETRLIEDNMNRRQLSRLGVARCYLHLKELGKGGWGTDEHVEGDLRDHLARRFKLSGRQLDRYARMLETPIAVQFAFERSQLTQDQVLAVLKLDADEQLEIAERIENGEVPTEFIQPYMQHAKATAVSAATAIFQLVGALEKAEQQLKHRFDEIPGKKLEPQIKKLDHGLGFIQSLQKQITEAAEFEVSSEDELNEFLDSVLR